MEWLSRHTAACLAAVLLVLTSTGCSSKKFAADLYDDVYWNGKNVNKGSSKSSKETSKSKESKSTKGKTTTSKGVYQKLGISQGKGDNTKLYTVAASWIGTKYKYGGCSKSGTDCSGLAMQIYKEVYGKAIDRSSSGIWTKNCKKIAKSQLQPGDLIFFRTDGKKSKTPNHVGVYLKENKFIHSTTHKGVIVSNLSEDYYVKSFLTYGRVK